MAGLSAPVAFASSVSGAVFSGGSGTVLVSGVLYAKSGAGLTLTVTTSSDTKCVEVSGSMIATQSSATAKTSWTFTTTAGAGDGARAVTAAPSPNVNSQGKCTGPSDAGQASYTLDNTGPIVTGVLAPAPNAAGWNRTNTTVTWSATDAGAGITSGPNPASASITASGITTPTTTATDRLGNSGVGSLTVRIDKTAPTITASQVKNANGTTTVTFTCADPTPQASGIASCVADGETANSKTVSPGVTVGGTATDAAGNTSQASATAPPGDTSAPTLMGTPTTSPNSAGWYSGDVTIDWTAGDAESGIPTPPADTTITGEGSGLTSATTVTNGAGLSTTAQSSPAVNIDRTAPTTGISGVSNSWVNGAVTVELTAGDNLSGVAKIEYTIDGGAVLSGASFTLDTDGAHTITFRSIDRAGNAEAARTTTVKIDRTAPTIRHTFTPLAYVDGTWTNSDVTVTFGCADQGGSGVAGCTAPVTMTAEGTAAVIGTATDGAGNTATDTASIRIDKTPPSISAVAGGTPNAAGWYNEPVIVTYTASDALSGVVAGPANDLLGEGADQSASATVTDAAGNSSTAGVSGINVDSTAPELTADYSTAWHTGDVTVEWTCTDALSGAAAQPDDTVVSGEGDNLSATASCADMAGNSTTKTVVGIKIDRSAPTTTASTAEPLDSGWHGDPVEVTLDGSDNLSGVVSTMYTLDDGEAQTYSGPFTLSADGIHTIEFWSTDEAGNAETAGAPLMVKIDLTAPTTTVINPISPDSGWFVTSGIPVAFMATDATSGVAATYYTIDGGDVKVYGDPFEAELSTGTHTITYWSIDLAGNVEDHATTNTVSVSVDTDAPTISGAAAPAPNAFGWNNTDVSVRFTCDDLGSGLQTGVAGCAGDTILVNDGANQNVKGDAVDVAGNKSAATVGTINIDKTKPTLVGVPITDANGAGWYKGDVAVKWVGDDALSGIDPASQPAPGVITGEGANLGAGPVTITDKAGNTSLPASVSGVKIDRTAPLIEGQPTTSANSAGWYKSVVTVDFTCTDALSGVAECPTSQMLSGDGADQSVTSDAARDVAGNESSGKTVTGINIDGQAPMSSSNNRCTVVNDWCTGDAADVVLTAVDQAGLSGVKEIHYRVGQGSEQVAAGSTVTVSVPLTGTGSATVAYYAIDNAGNVENTNTVGLKWDNIAPAVSHTLSPEPNAEDWNRTDVTVTFAAKDDDNGSGVAGVTPPVIVSSETAGLVVTGTAKDKADNVGTDAVTVRLDKTPPTISGAVTTGSANGNGWYNGPVTVTFTCSDALSGVATCPDPVILTDNGVNTAKGTVTDKAGNEATAQIAGIKIDQEKPTLTTAGVNVQGATFTVGSVPAATCTAADSYSGIASCVVTVTGGSSAGVGTFGYSAKAVDRAGNSTTITGTFRVVYRFDGFLQPINDTAHQIGASTSIFKAGSTVPVKFQLRNASGALVQATSAPAWMNPVKGSAMSMPVDESVYSVASDSGSAFRYDAAAQQYIYNWKTGSAGGNYWRIGVTLDDGQTYYVNIGLR